MRRYKGSIAGLLSVLVFFLLPFAHGDDEPGSHVRIVRLSYVEGQVQVAHSQGGAFENATMNVPLVEGDQVRTGADGWVEIQLENGSMIRLAPETQLGFTLMSRFRSGATVTEVDLEQGEAQFAVVAGDEDGIFRINIRNRVISLKRPSRFRVTSDNSDPLEVAVWKGEVGVFDSNEAKEVTVKKNETFVLDPQDAGHYDLEREIEADDLDKWSLQRDQYLITYASNNSHYTQSPYQYGLSDLSYYGQYSSVAGCGYCWQPYGVGADWDPYMNGYWMNSPWGYSWVSAYPWGWMPYRFGQWMFVPGFGWVWQPGMWNNWIAAPRFVNPPRGFRPPAPPSAGAKTSVALSSPTPGRSFNGGSASLTVDNQHGRQIISNENAESPNHMPAPQAAITVPNQQNLAAPPRAPARNLPPAVITSNSPGFHRAPPVDNHVNVITGPGQSRVNTSPAAPMHSSPAPQPTSRPQSFSPPPAPRVFSPPATSRGTSSGRPR